MMHSLKAATFLLLGASAAMAHGDQEKTYLGSECRLRGDFERGTTNVGCSGTPQGTPWRDLQGVSVFGSFSNLNRCNQPASTIPTSPAPDMRHSNIGDMIVTCPIPRGAIRKGSGITAHVKVETTARHSTQFTQNEQINVNLRCELLNINSEGNGSDARDNTGNIVASTGGVFQNNQSIVHTLQLSLSESNASSDARARDSGGYVINCVLPGMRNGKPSRIIQYTVREAD